MATAPTPARSTNDAPILSGRSFPGGRDGLAIAALVMASGLAIGLADFAGVQGRGGVEEALRVAGATILLFGLAGAGPVRLWLPEQLKAFELLWVVPTGACAVALEMGVLAYAKVPFDVNLVVVMAFSLGLAAYAVRRDPVSPVSAAHGRASWRAQLVPLYLAMLIGAIAVIPMFRGGFATVIGNGSDAHLAVGTAEFLQHHAPREEAISEPVDRVPYVWDSKPPIYLAYGGVAQISGLQPFQVIAPLLGALLGMAALGFWLLARHMLRASLWGAALAMSLVGLDRMVLYTGMHPYFNQTWGYFAMPFSIVLAWLAVKHRSRGTGILAGAFMAVVAFAYPLALPFPLLPALTFLALDRRRQGLPLVPRPRRPKARKSYLWIVPLAILMIRALIGVFEKIETALRVVAPWETLINWGGDQVEFIPERYFFGVTDAGEFALLIPLLVLGALVTLRRAPREVRIGLAAVIIGSIVAALYFRPRDSGQYFHFKILAFGAPILVAVATVGLSQFRGWARWPRSVWFAPVALVVMISFFRGGAADELSLTYDQIPRHMIALQELDETIPKDQSIRLDLQTDGRHFWIAYMLHGHRLCSQKPITDTSYPHEPISRAADLVLVEKTLRPPADSIGDPVYRTSNYLVYKLRPGLPGGDRCSQRMVQPIVVVR